jgi:hypothetical protein
MTYGATGQPRLRQNQSESYTVKTGDFRLLVSPSLGLDYNDQVNLSQRSAESDLILRPMVTFNASHPIAQRNILRLNVGIGYDKYFEHDKYSGLRLQSGSELSFDASVKDFLFNVHDRFQYSQDSASKSEVAGSGGYGGFDNTAGLSTTWDLRDVTLSVGYDHQNFISSTSEFESASRTSEIFSPRAGFRLNPRLTVGVEGTVAMTANEQRVLNNSTSYSPGIYADWRPGNFFQIQPRVGYSIYSFEQTSQSLQAQDMNGWYAGVTVSHQPTDFMSYAVSVGQEIRLGIQADAVESTYFRPSFTWKIIKNVNLTSFLSYDHGTQGSGQQRTGGLSESYDWYGGGLGASYALTKKLSMSMNYRVTTRSSDASLRNYTQNLVGIQLTYLLQ